MAVLGGDPKHGLMEGDGLRKQIVQLERFDLHPTNCDDIEMIFKKWIRRTDGKVEGDFDCSFFVHDLLFG